MTMTNTVTREYLKFNETKEVTSRPEGQDQKNGRIVDPIEDKNYTYPPGEVRAITNNFIGGFILTSLLTFCVSSLPLIGSHFLGCKLREKLFAKMHNFWVAKAGELFYKKCNISGWQKW